MDIMLFGAGKIGRGFIGHLLWKGGYTFQFVEANRDVAKLLKERKTYSVRIMGEHTQTDYVTGFSALNYSEIGEILESIANDAKTIFISVGGKNLPKVGEVLREGLLKRMGKENNSFLNIVLCENWIEPANVLKTTILEGAMQDFISYLDKFIGITESVIMRSAIDPPVEVLKQDPLAINVQDFWYLPVDKTRLKSLLPEIPGLTYIDNFNGYLERKFYTYNTANGTVSYLGYLKGYRYLSEATGDPQILKILEKIYEETGKALCQKHGFDYKDQMEFARISLAKLRNPYIVDYIERNARDPIRKLGPKDRLVGPARLVISYGGIPDGLSTAIAAAIHYDEPSDPIALKLKEIRLKQGYEYILENICKLNENDDPLKSLILEKIEFLKENNWIIETLAK